MRTLLGIGWIMAVIILCSCGVLPDQEYSLAFRNIGKHDIFVTCGTMGNYAPPVGILIPGCYKCSGGHCGIPESVKIKWEKANKEIVEREIKVKEKLPQRFGPHDCIVININDNDEVLLSFERFGQPEIDSNGKEVHYDNASSKN